MSSVTASAGATDKPDNKSGNIKGDWDQVMLAMDVVDTLRHREAELDRLVNEHSDDKALIARVQRIYKAQGIEVTDRVVRDAVEALKQERFVYQPPAASWKRRLAHWYVRRGRWGRKVGIAGAAAVAIGGGSMAVNGYQSFQQSGLQQHFTEVAAAAKQVAKTPAAIEAVTAATVAAELAVSRGEGGVAAVDELERLSEQLAASYQLRVVAEQGKRSGFYRNPKGRLNVRNHYIIVDAIAPNGKLVKVPVTSEEDNSVNYTSRWGLRVSEQAFDALRRDKQDDGIVQNNIVGRKAAGALRPEYSVDSSGAAILKW